MSILKYQIFGGSLIGVYFEANNSFILHPPLLIKDTFEKFKKVFSKPLYPLTINNSNLLGVYFVSNKHGIIVPHIIKDDELDKLKSYVNGEVEIGILDSLDNAFGNLILCNDKGAIISSLLRGYKNEIENILNVETEIFEFAGSYLPGSISLANNNGCLVHPLATDEEIEKIKSILKVEEIDVSTINRGIPYLRAGAIVNDSSGVFGMDTTGPEMMRLTSVLKL